MNFNFFRFSGSNKH